MSDVLERLPDGAHVSATWSSSVSKWHVRLIIPAAHNALANNGEIIYAGSGATIHGIAMILAYQHEDELKKETKRRRRKL